jgi:hypothetical protein
MGTASGAFVSGNAVAFGGDEVAAGASHFRFSAREGMWFHLGDASRFVASDVALRRGASLLLFIFGEDADCVASAWTKTQA